MTAAGDGFEWVRAIDGGDLDEGRVMTAVAAGRVLAMTHYNGSYGAFDNRCPHNGGPLGEGSIEHGLLRCPWHGYDYDPISGEPTGGFSDVATSFAVEVRDGGVYVALPEPSPHIATVSDVMAETFVNWGVSYVFGMVGSSNLGMADAFRRLSEDDRLSYIGVRHEGAASFAASAYAKLTGRPAACFAIAGPGATNLLTGLWDAKSDRAPVLALTGQVASQVMGPGAFQEIDLSSAFEAVTGWSQTVHADSNHVELANLAVRHAILGREVAHLIFPDEVQRLPAPEGVTAGRPEGGCRTSRSSRLRRRSPKRWHSCDARSGRRSSSAMARGTTWSRPCAWLSCSRRRSSALSKRRGWSATSTPSPRVCWATAARRSRAG